MPYKKGIYVENIRFNDEKEENMFEELLNSIKTDKPTMIEIGSFWCFWTMFFQKTFKENNSIIIEPYKPHLEEGLRNLKANNMKSKVYNNSVLVKSIVKVNQKSKEAIKKNDPVFAKEIDLIDILSKEKIKHVDILHCDAQGIEYDLLIRIKDIINQGVFSNLLMFTHSQINHDNIKQFAVNNNIKIVKEFPWKPGDGLLWLKNN